MKNRIANILDGCEPSIYIYGSVVLDDFKLGWSDIDILVLTEKEISQNEADILVKLRQALMAEYPENPYYRLFEGGILTFEAFLSGKPACVVYWGTSGERITDKYEFNAFCMSQFLDSSILIYGNDVRNRFSHPDFEDLKAECEKHYKSIRRYAQKTERSIYSYGWMLDISRCIYTLRTGKIASKTYAGEWALNEKLCPCENLLVKIIEIRKEPLKYKNNDSILEYAETIGAEIQKYADVLEKELYKV